MDPDLNLEFSNEHELEYNKMMAELEETERMQVDEAEASRQPDSALPSPAAPTNPISPPTFPLPKRPEAPRAPRVYPRPSNGFAPRPIRGFRGGSYCQRPFYRDLDSAHRPQVSSIDALDYDDSPQVLEPTPSEASIAPSSHTTRSSTPPIAPKALTLGQPHYNRGLLQYEDVPPPIYREFYGYDDIDPRRLESIWFLFGKNHRKLEDSKSLASYHLQEYIDQIKLDHIDCRREYEAWRRRDLTPPITKENPRSAHIDQWKLINGPKLEDDSYKGPGPTRELQDASKGLSLNEVDRYVPEEKDVDMDASPYNDRRRDGGGRRGGGGRHSYGGGGGGGRKRGREDDDDGRDYMKRQNRPRYEEPIASRIRRDIIFLGEESLQSSAQDHCAAFGRDIANNFEDDQVRGNLMDTIVAMICEQPLKIPFIAAVVLYANDLNADVSKELIARTNKRMAYTLELGEWRDFKLLLRFQACLQGILEGNGVFQILNQLFDWVIDLQSSSAEDALGLELTKIILLTIPYALAASTDAQNQLGDLLDKTEIVAGEAANHPLASLVDPFPINGEEKPFGFQSIVELLQQQLREEASQGWALKCIARPYVAFKALKAEDREDGAAKESTKHALPALTIPLPVDIFKKPLVPETFFTMFAEQDIHTTPSMNDISLSLIRDTMADTISILHYNRLAVANFLTTVDQFWAPGTFATRGISLDQLRNYPPERSKWKPEDMFIDAVFSQLLVLPDADQKLVYYHSIIFEACKLAPSAVAPTLGRGIRWLFRHVDDMDLELVYRLLDWFAHHLSNFEFRWKWTEWIGELDRSDISPKKAFIIAALDKEVRLSFAKRIRDTLPEPYYSLLSEGKFKDIPPFKYDSDDTPFASEGKEIYKSMKQKAPEEQIQPYIDAIQEQAANHGLDPLLASTDVYMTAMCHNGAKSVSHITAAMDRSKTRLQEARQASAGVGRQIVESVVSYWKDQPGNAVNIIDKLLNYNIILPDSVIEWALGPESLTNGAVLSQAWRYEIVAKTMTKVTGRVQEIAQAKIKLETEYEYEPTDKLKESIPQVNDFLNAERPAMRQLFATIDDAVNGVASGATDGFLEQSQNEEDAEHIKVWGEKWLRTFRRKLAVVDARVGENAVEAQLVSAKEQYKLTKERETREKAEEEAAREKERQEREARIAKEQAEREAAEAAAAAEANGDIAMDGADANGHADNEDLDVAE